MIRKLLPVFIIITFLSSYKYPFRDEAKLKAMADYMDEYLGCNINLATWNGTVKGCNAGNLPASDIIKVEKRINYLRSLAGLGKIKLIDSLNFKAQQIALLALANNKTNELPSKNWKCYEPKSENVAAYSSIGNLSSDNILTSFIEEPGSANIFCPHRRLLLFSGASEMGYGATNKTEALYFSKDAKPMAKSTPEFIAYPGKGYVPSTLVFPKWSFAIPGARKVNFAYTNVIVKDQKGGIIVTSPYNTKGNIFDNTYIWDVAGMFAEDEIAKGRITLKDRGYTNQLISVEINKVIVDGEMRNFKYDVFILDV